MAEQDVLISLNNLEDYHTELLKNFPKEQVWYGEIAPPEDLEENYLVGIDGSSGTIYYRTAYSGWKKVTSGGLSSDKIESKITLTRVSEERIYTSFEEEKCEITCKWLCYINNKSVKVNGKVTIYINDNEKESFTTQTGTFTKDIKPYLKQGTNEVVFEVKDGYNSVETIVFYVNLLDIVVSAPNFSQNSVFKHSELKTQGDSENEWTVGISVRVNGAVEKYLHMLIDGREYTGIEQFCPSGEHIKNVQIPFLSHGSHIIEFYATYTDKKKTVYSNTIVFDVIYWDDVTPKTDAVLSSSFFQTEGKQYEILKIPYFIYKEGYEYSDALFSKILYEENAEGEVIETIEYTSTIPQKRKTATEFEWSTSSDKAGPNIFQIQVGTYKENENKEEIELEKNDVVTKKIEKVQTAEGENPVYKMMTEIKRQTETNDGIIEELFLIEEGTFTVEDARIFSIQLEAQTLPDIQMYRDLLSIDFLAEQTDNNDDSKKALWESNSSEIQVTQSDGQKTNLRANFTNFDWINNGWEIVDNRSALKISNGAGLEIPYPIFAQQSINHNSTQFSIKGATISVDFSFDEVSEPETDFLTCFDGGIGFKVSPSRALLSNGESSVQVEYASSESKKYNKSMRVDFVFYPIQARTKTPQNSNDPPIVNDRLGAMYIYINGVGAAASEYYEENFAHFKNVLFNSLGCTVHLHSFRVFNTYLQPNQILRNWIYDMNPASKINAYNRNWIYDGNSDIILNTKIQERIPYMIITAPGGKLPKFKGDKKTGVKLSFRGTEDGLYDFDIDDVELDVQGTSSQYYPVKNWKFKSTYKVKDEEGNETKKKNLFKTATGESETYALGEGQIPEKVFCLKADYMETSSTHNTVTANLANSMYDNKKYGKTPPQLEGKELTPRTTIYGRPIVVFYKDSDGLTFGGKYNFNYDKGAESVFGFSEDENYEVIDCVEFRENRNDRCLLKISDYTEKSKETDPATIEKDYEEKSWITDASGKNIVGAYEWGAAFEFRYFYHKNKSGQPYAYLQGVTDWVVSTDCENATNKPFKAGEEPVFERGTANFEYDDKLDILQFWDGQRMRRAVDIGEMDANDYAYKLQTYLTVKKYRDTEQEDDGDKVEEYESLVYEKDAFLNEQDESLNQYTVAEAYWKNYVDNYISSKGQAAWDNYVANYKKTFGERAWNEYVTSYIEKKGQKAWDTYVNNYKAQEGEKAWSRVEEEENKNKDKYIEEAGNKAWEENKDSYNQEEYITQKGEEAWEEEKLQYNEEEYIAEHGQEAWDNMVLAFKQEKGQEAWNNFVADYKKKKGQEAWTLYTNNYKAAAGELAWNAYVEDYVATAGEEAWEAYVADKKEEPWNNFVKDTQAEDGKYQKSRVYHSLFFDENWGENGQEVYKFTKDTRDYRLTKFKTELPEHFNEHYCLMYFLLMELLAMIDSSTKNMFWATWGERHDSHKEKDENGEYKDKVVIWYPIFYDMDTMMGVNNTGKMNIPYNIEFDSLLEGSETGYAYNGHDNVFWNNFREAYLTELGSLFRQKISEGVFSLDGLLKTYEDHSEQFFEALYNEDGKLKIIDSYFKGYQTDKGEEFPDWLHVYQGDRYYYRRYWLPNRFNYLLSKNFAGDYASDFVSMRLNDPRGKESNVGKDIEVDYDFDIVTWCDQYTRVKYGGRTVSKRSKTGETTTIEAPEESYNDTETAIYGASNLKSIGSLANKYASTIDLSKASRLLEINLGSDEEGYDNSGLTSIGFGSNTMLRKVNIQNCSGMSGMISLESCPNITEINAKGTSIQGIKLPNQGALKTLLLPPTINNLTIKNQPNLQKYLNVDGKESGFLLPKGDNGKYNLKTLCVVETKILSEDDKDMTKDMVENSMDTLQNLYLDGINWELQTDTLLFNIIDKSDQKSLYGRNFNEKPILRGDCSVASMKDYLIDRVNLFFNGKNYAENINDRPFRLRIDPENVINTCVVTVLNSKGEKIDVGLIDDRIQIGTSIKQNNNESTPPNFQEPEKEATWKEEYQFRGWIYEEEIVEEGKEKTIYSSEEMLNLEVPDKMTFKPVYYTKPKLFKFELWSSYDIENPNSSENELKKDHTFTLVVENHLCLDDNNEVHMTTYPTKAIAPEIPDNYNPTDFAWRYKKWASIDTTKNGEITKFNFIWESTEKEIKEFDVVSSLAMGEDGNPLFDISPQFNTELNCYVFKYKHGPYDTDRKYKYAFVDRVTTDEKKKVINNVHYVGDEIERPKHLKVSTDVTDFNTFYTDDKVYTFEGWKLIKDKTIEQIIESDWEVFYDADIQEKPKIDIDDFPETVKKEENIYAPTSYIYCAVYSSTYRPYAITFKNHAGKIIYENEFSYGKKPTYGGTEEDKQREGHTWTGWEPEITKVTGEATYITTHSINTYTITYRGYQSFKEDDDNSRVERTKQVVYNVKIPEIEPIERIGYEFKGWKIITPSDLTELPTNMPADHIELEAIYEIINYNITFKGYTSFNESSPVSKNWTLHYNDPITLPNETEFYRTGYDFKGWQEEIPERMPAADQEFNADYEKIEYIIKFVDYDNTPIKTTTQYYNSSITKPTNPSRTGYTFKYWTIDGQNKVTVDSKVTQSRTYKAYYTINQYTITFAGYQYFDKNASGSKVERKITQNYGTTIEQPAAIERVGYNFVGWDKTIPPTMPAENQTINAVYDIIKCTVTFEFNNGEENFVKEYNYNDPIIKPNNPTKRGYDFIDWNKTIQDKVTSDITYVAQYKAKSYDITFNGYTTFDEIVSGKVTKTISVPYNEKIVLPEDEFKREGYDLAWDIPKEYIEPDQDRPAENLVFDARYDIIKCTYQYVYKKQNNDGTTYEYVLITEQTNYNSLIERPSTAQVNGYDFDGWWLNNDFEGSSVNLDDFARARNKTFVAKYTPKKIWVHFYKDEPEEQKNYWSEQFDYESVPFYNFAEKESPIKDKDNTYTYSFYGWEDDIGDITEKDKTLPKILSTKEVKYKAYFQETYIEYPVTFYWIPGDLKTTANPSPESYSRGISRIYNKETGREEWNKKPNATIGLGLHWESEIPIPDNISLTGYTYNGWSPTPVSNRTETRPQDIFQGNTIKINAENMKKYWNAQREEFAFYMIWNINRYTVTFYYKKEYENYLDWNDSKNTNISEPFYNVDFGTVMTGPASANYKTTVYSRNIEGIFTNWTPKIDGVLGEAEYPIVNPITANTDYIANYNTEKTREYDIAWKVNGTTVFTSKAVYLKEIPIPSEAELGYALYDEVKNKTSAIYLGFNTNNAVCTGVEGVTSFDAIIKYKKVIYGNWGSPFINGGTYHNGNYILSGDDYFYINCTDGITYLFLRKTIFDTAKMIENDTEKHIIWHVKVNYTVNKKYGGISESVRLMAENNTLYSTASNSNFNRKTDVYTNITKGDFTSRLDTDGSQYVWFGYYNFASNADNNQKGDSPKGVKISGIEFEITILVDNE